MSHSHDNAAAVDELLAGFQADDQSDRPLSIQKALFVASRLQSRATTLQSPQERRQQAELDRMIHNLDDKTTLMQLTDQAFRSNTPHRAVDQLTHILDVQGVPRFFSPVDRALLKGFQSFGSYLPGVAVPLVKDKMHKETANVILPAETDTLVQHLNQRREERVRMNVNFLGEALLGETEATRRLNTYLQALQISEIEVISVKISTIFSQISPLAREHSIQILCDRMELLYRAAAKETFQRSEGTTVPKFVYLDMEEYRDMPITADVFMRCLSRPGLEQVRAGLALQAYIPDSFVTQREITHWARDRVARGGAPVTMRIVKGANMEMERHEASLRGWPQATFKSKLETDANYKRMLEFALSPRNAAAVNVGIASHNLFDLAYGLVLASENGVLDLVQFEMLEGMANHQRRALFELNSNLLLYAPACKNEEFIHAIGYLVRRLDENTGPDNFLRHAFKLDVGTKDWHRLESGFLDAFDAIPTVSDLPRRRQDRRTEFSESELRDSNSTVVRAVRSERDPGAHFRNEPDTDFSLPQNSRWASEIVQRWHDQCDERAATVPLVVAGKEIADGRKSRDCIDPSRPGVLVGRYSQASGEDVVRAVACAVEDPDGWRSESTDSRCEILSRVASQIRRSRADLMGAALADGGKTLSEADPEVSEAIDFLEFYSQSAKNLSDLPGVTARGRGVVAVVSPWNFPIAIPCGGIAAALAAGNTVILKPASDTVLVAYKLCECFWRAGLSRKVLQFMPCSGATEGQALVTHPDVETVILTGGTETAIDMLRARPGLRLLAETGGKNATIVTALADRDQAIKHVLHSAFGHSGQKCSATSLLILEDEVFHDARFRESLRDAVESLIVGSAWDLKSRIGPLIRPPGGDLERGLKELESGETWAVMPRQREGNRRLYSPGIKWNVQPGSFTHMTELFGPVLGVMRARNLNEAIDFVNSTGFGLTSGLESLDDREQETWLARIRAGNLYVNRSTTGAIVLRQPFGGMGKSSFGPGIKAGGPNYVAQLMHFESEAIDPDRTSAKQTSLKDLVNRLSQPPAAASDGPSAEEIRSLQRAVDSYEEYAESEFSAQHDHFKIIGQDNIRRYLPVRELRVRVEADDEWLDIVLRVCAARAAGCRITVSVSPDYTGHAVHQLDEYTDSWAAGIEFIEETTEELAAAVLQGQTDRIRFSAPSRVPDSIRQAAARMFVHVADQPVQKHGRLELIWYVQEQSVSVDYHRYGNLGKRADEIRDEPQ